MPEKPLLPGSSDVVVSAPGNVLAALDELLKRPAITVGRATSPEASRMSAYLAGAGLAAAMVYGLAAGFFQGGTSLLVAMVKAPLVLAVSVLLCVPSLYITSALLGANLTARRFWLAVAGFAGMIGILMLGLVPIVWLFSVSSRSLGFVTVLHALLWMLIVGFSARFLSLALRESGAQASPFLWVVLFVVVSFQVATVFRPMLWLGPETKLFQAEKLFFLEHFDRIMSMPAQGAERTPRR
jgi:hypothetical protein